MCIRDSDYKQYTQYASFDTSDAIWFKNNSGINTGAPNAPNTAVTATPSVVEDWYDKQVLGLENSVVYWKSLAPKPVSNNYVTTRKGKNDGMHIAVVDDFGTISGIQGAILEKHVGLSKAEDAISAINSPQKIYYKQYLADYSDNIYAGYNVSAAKDTYWDTDPIASGFGTACTPYTLSLIHI